MNARAASLQGLLALLGLIAAYLTWQREPSPDARRSVVIDTNKRSLEKIRYEEGSQWVELTSSDDGKTVWARFSGKEGSTMALPSGHPVVQTAIPQREVRGNDSAQSMWNRFAPLTASRALGVLDDETLEAVRLKKAKRRLVVTHNGRTSAFALTAPPTGASAPYIRSEDDGQVFVVAPQILNDFKAAKSNLIERRLHDFVMTDVDEVVIAAGDREQTFAYRRAEDGVGGNLFPKGQVAQDQTASNWHTRIFALFPAEVLGRDEPFPDGEPNQALRIEYRYRGDVLGFVELAHSGDAQAAPEPGATPRSQALARTEFTAGWVRLGVEAQALLSEGRLLFGEPEAVEPNSPKTDK